MRKWIKSKLLWFIAVPLALGIVHLLIEYKVFVRNKGNNTSQPLNPEENKETVFKDDKSSDNEPIKVGSGITVTFTGGSIYGIDFSVQLQIEPQNAPLVFTSVGNYEQVKKYLTPIFKSKVLSLLEKHEYSYVKTHRSELELKAKELIKPEAEKIGVTIHGVSFGEFTALRKE